MGNTDTKLNFRKAVVQLTTRTQPVEAGDEAFWSQFWSESATCVQDVFTLIPAAEIRALREESPSNLATLCYKAVEKLVQVAEAGCRSQKDEQMVLNCVRLLSRVLPYIFEDPDWRGFFWSTLPGQKKDDSNENDSIPLAQSLLTALCDLLFCPDFTVSPNRKSGPDNPEDIATIDSCEYIWASGVGFTHNPPTNATYDQNRAEILKLLLTCFSETMYLPPLADAHLQPNQWIAYFTSTDNRHALPLFTSLLNIICSYDPVGYGMPYNHLMFSDFREPLVEVALHVLCVTLDSEPSNVAPSDVISGAASVKQSTDLGGPDNLFVNYLSRIHREEDFAFILKGLTRLLNNPLMQTYLPGSCKRIQFHQELLVFFWKICDINKKFMFYVLKSSDVLDVLVPILYFLNDARSDQSRVGLMHIGVFILLLLSGERNFGVRLNKPYTVRVPMDIPVFTGSHADLLIIVFHKIITTGHQRLQPLFDCLLTIIVNVSPYLKTLSMVASTKLLHLLEAFSTPWFLFASPTNHHLMFFLLEVFNNIIQYQFDGNSSLVYTIIRKRQIFHQLANLPTDHSSIAKALTKTNKKFVRPESVTDETPSMEGSIPASEAEPGTLQASLAATPVIPLICAKFSYHAIPDPGSGSTSAFDHEFEANRRPNVHPFSVQTEDPWSNRVLTAMDDASRRIHPKKHSIQSLAMSGQSANHQKLFMQDKDLTNGDHGKKKDLTNYDYGEKKDLTNGDHGEKKDLTNGSRGEKNNTEELLVSLSQLASDAESKPRSYELSEVKLRLAEMIGIEKMTEKAPASTMHTDQTETNASSVVASETSTSPQAISPAAVLTNDVPAPAAPAPAAAAAALEASTAVKAISLRPADAGPDGMSEGEGTQSSDGQKPRRSSKSQTTPPASPVGSTHSYQSSSTTDRALSRRGVFSTSVSGSWVATPEWIQSWKQKLPLQTIMRLLQVLVPQVEKICIDKGLTDESEILKFLQHGTLVGLLPVPHPILIRKYQANCGTTMWFRTYMWGVIYLRNVDPPIWYDTDVKLFEIQRV